MTTRKHSRRRQRSRYSTSAKPRLERLEDRNLFATFAVNSFDDFVDSNPGDGVCGDGSGICGIRPAIIEANALPGKDTIVLSEGVYQLLLEGRGEDAAVTGDLDITDDLTIVGAGADTTIIDANQLDRVFDVIGSVNVTLEGVTVRNGELVELDEAGGAVRNQAGSLTIIDSILENNTAVANGGAVHSTGTLTVARSRFSNNSATGAKHAGAMFVSGSSTIIDSTFNGNSATDSSGAIYFGSGDHEVRGSTFFDNSAQNGGGAIRNEEGTVRITNSTFSGNVAGQPGGAILVTHTAELTAIVNSTIVFNTAGQLPSSTRGGGIFKEADTVVTLQNSVVANNSSGQDPDVGHNSPFTSLGGNVIGRAKPGSGLTGEFVGVDPMLGPLQQNGGPTLTHAPLPASPLIDVAPFTSTLGVDQRGLPRPQDGDGDGVSRADIGAVEYVDGLVVSSFQDASDASPGDGVCDDGEGRCTLRAAIEEANLSPGEDSIWLPAGTYKLSLAGRDEDAAQTGDLDITDDLAIIGAGAGVTVVDADGIDRALDVRPDTSLSLSDLTITGGSAVGLERGAGIYNGGDLYVLRSNIIDNHSTGRDGGGIAQVSDNAQLTVAESLISGNSSVTDGGGIGVRGGTVHVRNSVVSSNQAQGGGGISVRGGIVTITDTTLSENNATSAGGGILLHDGSLTVGRSSLLANTVSGGSHVGGGLFMKVGLATFESCVIAGHDVSNRGGGIQVDFGTLRLTNCTIVDNSAVNDGGGIDNFQAKVELRNTIVAGNSSADGGQDLSGSFTSLGHNVIGNGDGANGISEGDNGDQVGSSESPVDSRLDAPTYVPLPDSPAVDAGDNANASQLDRHGAERVVDGDKDGMATIDIGAVEFDPRVLAVRLDAVDLAGHPIHSVVKGDEFVLRGHVQDLRDEPDGVFATYFDVTYSESHASVVGPLEFGGEFKNVLSGDIATSGQIDEVGGTVGLSPSPGEQLLFSVRLQATNAGSIEFTTDPADLLPHHDSLLIALDSPLNSTDIRFGTLSFQVLPQVIANSDIASGDEDHVIVIDPLANDVGSDLSITAFDAATTHGAVVSRGGDGGLVYDARNATTLQGLDVTETLQDTFTYTVTDAHGTSATATVTINVSGVNDAPVVEQPLQDQLPQATLISTLEFSFTFATNTFSDPEGNTLTYQAQLDSGAALPGWLSFDPVTRTFHGTPWLSDLGDYTITLQARDDGDPSLVATESLSVVVVNPYRNPAEPLDVNADGFVTPLDALLIINHMNADGPASLPVPPQEGSAQPPFVDVSNDLFVTPIDALLVINYMNRLGDIGEGEASTGATHTNGPVALSSVMAPSTAPSNTTSVAQSQPPKDAHALVFASVGQETAALPAVPGQAARIAETSVLAWELEDLLSVLLSDLIPNVTTSGNSSASVL